MEHTYSESLVESLCMMVDNYPNILSIMCNQWGVSADYQDGIMNIPVTIRRLAREAIRRDNERWRELAAWRDAGEE